MSGEIEVTRWPPGDQVAIRVGRASRVKRLVIFEAEARDIMQQLARLLIEGKTGPAVSGKKPGRGTKKPGPHDPLRGGPGPG